MDDAASDAGEDEPGIVSPATDAACVVLETLVALGARHIVVSPGSRSQALALAADALERRGIIRMHVRIDERSAGFTALGLGRESGVPAALVCTSGTAAANYLPAVLEAHHSGVPLLLLTADRPPELRGVGANQTTDQVGIFGGALRFLADAPVPEGGDGEPEEFRSLAMRAFACAARGADGAPRPAGGEPLPGPAGQAAECDDGGTAAAVPGPAQLNLPFREPLAGALPPRLGALVDAQAVREEARRRAPEPGAPAALERGRRTVVLAGADAGDAALEAARDGGWPLLAEVISGARTTPDAIASYRLALREPSLGGRIERIVVFGHPTLNREETSLLLRDDVEIVAVRRGGEALDLNGETLAAPGIRVVGGEADAAWLRDWERWSLAHRARPASGLLDRETLVGAVWRASGGDDRVVFGSSRLVRVADDVLPPRAVRVHANRGLAGIDGTIATGIGVALASQDRPDAAGVTRVVLGDLAFLHDVGSLLLPVGEPAPRIQVIVGNDGGGTIFDGLEVARVAGREAMDRVQYTPQAASLPHLATAYGWAHTRVETAAELAAALAAWPERPHIVEVPLPR